MSSFLNFLDSVPVDPCGATLILCLCLAACPSFVWLGRTLWPAPCPEDDDCPGSEERYADWQRERNGACGLVAAGCVCLLLAALIGTVLLRRLF